MFIAHFNNLKKGNNWLSTLALLVLVLSGCSSDDNNKSPVIEESPTTGIWSAPAYGIVVDISETDFKFYQFTSEYCQAYPLEEYFSIDFEALVASSEAIDEGSYLYTTLAGIKVPGITMNKQDTLPQPCIDNFVPSIGEANYEFDPLLEFEIFWATFNKHYAFFDIEAVNWDEVYAQASQAITNNTTEEDLFEVFAQMIATLNDFHVEIINPELGFEYASPARKPTIENIALMDFLSINELENISSEQECFQYLEYLSLQKEEAFAIIISNLAEGEDVHFNDSQTIFWARLNDDIGYLLLNTMDDVEIGGSEITEENLLSLSVTMDQMLEELEGVEGLVVDVRYNEGGDDFVSQYIAGRLTNQPFDAYSKQARLGQTRTSLQNIVINPRGYNQYSGPIALLASMSTASAAETFTLAMRERMDTVIIGERTAGGFSDQLIKTLPSGLLYTLSNEFYLSVADESFEGEGVPVDIEKPFFTLEQRDLGQDLGFESAIEWLLNF